MSKNLSNRVIGRRSIGLSICSTLLAVLIIGSGCNASSETASSEIVTKDWVISRLDVSQLHWGAQRVVVRVQNTSGDYKFFVAQSETRSPLRRYSAVRKFQSNYIFVPDEEKEISFIVDVLENLSYVTLKLGFYDVVDTLDDVRFGKDIFVDTLSVTAEIPSGLVEFENTMPRAGSVLKYNPSLNTDLSLLIHQYLREPLSATALTKRLGAPFAVVSRVMRTMEQYGFVRIDEKSLYQSTLTTIDGLSASSNKTLIDVYSKKMSDALEVALPKFVDKRQEMMDAGLVTKGTSATLEGTGMVQHLFPLVGGIVLWEAIGSQFIIGGDGPAQLISVDGPCNETAEGYGYVLVDSSLSDGDEFYFYDSSTRHRVFGDHVPSVTCIRTGPSVRTRPSYRLPVGKITLMYYYDKERVAKVVNVLSDPLVSIRGEFEVAVKAQFERDDITLTSAHRYWLWNQLASSVMARLVKSGALEDGMGEFYTWQERN